MPSVLKRRRATAATCVYRLRCASERTGSECGDDKPGTALKELGRGWRQWRARKNADSQQQDGYVTPCATPIEGARPNSTLVAPCYQPAKPGHRMANPTVKGVRVAEPASRSGAMRARAANMSDPKAQVARPGEKGGVGALPITAPGTGTGAPWRRPRAAAAVSDAPEPWLDLSTGINPVAYPVSTSSGGLGKSAHARRSIG